MNKLTAQIIEQFKQRQTGAKRGRIPNHIKAQALNLCESYKPTEVAGMLGITSRTLSNWRLKLKNKNEETDFICLTPSQTTKFEVEDNFSMTVRIGKDLEVVLQNQPLDKTLILIKALNQQQESIG